MYLSVVGRKYHVSRIYAHIPAHMLASGNGGTFPVRVSKQYCNSSNLHVRQTQTQVGKTQDAPQVVLRYGQPEQSARALVVP